MRHDQDHSAAKSSGRHQPLPFVLMGIAVILIVVSIVFCGFIASFGELPPISVSRSPKGMTDGFTTVTGYSIGTIIVFSLSVITLIASLVTAQITLKPLKKIFAIGLAIALLSVTILFVPVGSRTVSEGFAGISESEPISLPNAVFSTGTYN